MRYYVYMFRGSLATPIIVGVVSTMSATLDDTVLGTASVAQNN